MAAHFQFTPQASDDIEAIWNSIARDRMDSANRVEEAILDACNRLVHNPLLGTRRPRVTSRPLRFWTVTEFPNYVIVYLPQSRPLQIVAVLHGKRQIAALLKKHENR